MGRWLSLMMIVILAACGGKDGAGIAVDAAADIAKPGDTKGDSPDQCAASCVDRECGDDGCGGNCGTCAPFLEQCTDTGICEAFPCDSSKDCPGSLVCAEDKGECVACVGDEDCPEEEVCGADHECHAPITCDSDKECKDDDMICDKDAGLCVECLKNDHCEDDAYCEDGYCIGSICTAGESKCDGNQVLACTDGSGWTVKQTCGEAQYCEDAACHDGCEAGAVWCDGDVYKVCADDGKSVQYEEDCAAKEQHCFGGACIDTICVADSIFCIDDDTAAACANDGMSFNEADCPAENYCEDGNCKAWVCEPGMATCEGDVAQQCNAAGSSFASETNCAASGKKCVGGECLDLACVPDEAFCVDKDTAGICAQDGLSFESTDCQEQQSCDLGLCTPWLCTPEEPVCDGDFATNCNALGLGPAAGGTDCAGQDKFCSGGVCTDCEPVCDGKDCGDDGCGGQCGSCDDGDDCTVDECTDGECSHFNIPGCCTIDEDCDDGDDCTTDFCSAEFGCLHQDTVTCCGDGVQEQGEECDDANYIDGDGCNADCTLASPPATFLGYAVWDQDCSTQSDAKQDGLMDQSCKNEFGGSARAATHTELVATAIAGLPETNGTPWYITFKCPFCEGLEELNAVSGHGRKCAQPGPWPTSHEDPFWFDNCFGNPRKALCVLE